MVLIQFYTHFGSYEGMGLALTTSIKSIAPFAFLSILAFSCPCHSLSKPYLWFCIFNSLEIDYVNRNLQKVRSVIEFLLINVIHLIRHIFIHVIGWHSTMALCQNSHKYDLLLFSFSQIGNGRLSMLLHPGTSIFFRICKEAS